MRILPEKGCICMWESNGALDRLAIANKYSSDFAEMIKEKYHNEKIEYAVEDETDKNTYKVVLLTKQTIEVISGRYSPEESNPTIEITIDSYPLKSVTGIFEKYPKKALNQPSLNDVARKVDIQFSKATITIDLMSDSNTTKEQISDLNHLITELKKHF